MNDYFSKLFHYNHWANELLLQKLYECETQDAEIIKLMSHVINAQFIWFSRVSGNKALERKVWDLYNLHELPSASKESSRLWIIFISDLEEEKFNADIFYTNSQGNQFSTISSDIFIHVINHGTYHRGQIAKLLRQKNIDPPNTDYITYVRAKK